MQSWLAHLTESYRALWALAPHARHLHRRLGWALFGLIVCTMLEGIGIGLLVPLMALLFNPADSAQRPVVWLRETFPGHSPVAYLAMIAVGVAIAIVAKNMLALETARRVARLQRDTLRDLRTKLFTRFSEAPLDFFDRRSGGDLAGVFTQEAQHAVDAITAALSVAQSLFLALLYVAGVLWLSLPLGIGALLLGVGIGAVVAVVFRHLSRAGGVLTQAYATMTSRVLDMFGGVRVVRTSNAQDFEARRFAAANTDLADASEAYSRVHAVLPAVIECLAAIGAMTLMTVAYWTLVLPGRMSAVELSGFGLFLLRLVPLITRTYAAQGNLVYLSAGVQKVTRWLEMPIYPDPAFGTTDLQRITRGIEIRDLTFRYPGADEDALRDVSFTIPAGKIVALVGRSGSGKSTLASVLLRLRAPTAGTILVDGIDYWTVRASAWHARVGVVEQDVFLFNDTLAANVAYGSAAASPAAVHAALDGAYLGDVVSALPAGIDTLVGERGVTLSGGQRQRLAIARALLRAPDFLLLDEATSHLDTLSEHLVQAAIAGATSGRTTLVIAHRLSTIRRADHIVVLRQGAVAEQGTWDALMAADGEFAALVRQGLDTRDENM